MASQYIVDNKENFINVLDAEKMHFINQLSINISDCTKSLAF